MTTPIEVLKQSRSTLEMVAGIIAVVIYLNVWWSDLVVSRKDYLMGINEIRVAQVQAEIRAFKRTGLDTLSTEDREAYDELVATKKQLVAVRNRMLGITE